MIVRVVLVYVNVQRKIQRQYIDPWFAQDSELTPLSMLCHEPPNDRFIQSPHSCDAADLILGRGRADVRVQPTAGSGDQIDGKGKRIVGVGSLERVDASLHGFNQRVIGRAQIGPGRGGGLVGEW